MTGARRVVFGLGSNVGDRGAHLAAASAALAATPGLALVARSRVFETPPAGGPPQGDYLNSAVLFETALAPPEVMRRALEVEHGLGRVRPDPVRWGPRTIDVDILWIEGVIADTPDLAIPHPRLRER
ncbi:MAG TPA: 2-amino-4-hydroxy-6-hydroxymethyldihydropteridine diphosphokinase, partial [Byssovorax sp.]